MAEELKTIVGDANDVKSSVKKRYALSVDESKKLFGVCCNPSCKRPYLKGKKYPFEVCLACKNAGVKFNKKWLDKDGKPKKNNLFGKLMNSLSNFLNEDRESFEIAPKEAIEKIKEKIRVERNAEIEKRNEARKKEIEKEEEIEYEVEESVEEESEGVN